MVCLGFRNRTSLLRLFSGFIFNCFRLRIIIILSYSWCQLCSPLCSRPHCLLPCRLRSQVCRRVHRSLIDYSHSFVLLRWTAESIISALVTVSVISIVLIIASSTFTERRKLSPARCHPHISLLCCIYIRYITDYWSTWVMTLSVWASVAQAAAPLRSGVGIKYFKIEFICTASMTCWESSRS